MNNLEDLQREKSVLGALLQDQKLDSVEAAQGLLDAIGITSADFTSPKLARAFQAAEALLRQGRPADPHSVAEILTTGQPDALGAVFNGLRDLRAGTIMNRQLLGTQAHKLKKLSVLRRAGNFFTTQLKALAATSEPEAIASDMASFAQELSLAHGGYRVASEDIARIIEAQEEIQLGHRVAIIPTGIPILDDAIMGFRPTISVIAGGAGVGKTALGATLIENISQAFAKRSDGAKIGLFALEDGTEALTSRIVARHSGLAWGAIGSVRLSDWQLERFQDGLGAAHPVMDRVEKFESPDSGITATQLAAVARDWVLHRNVKIIFVDHLGELEPEDNDREKHYLRVRRMVKDLRSIAIRYSVPVVLFHHFNREAQKTAGGQPSLHHLAESDYLGRMCRLALGLWPGSTDGTLNISILKQTRGPSGITMGSKVIVLNRLKEAAMVSSIGGYVMDLDAENGS